MSATVNNLHQIVGKTIKTVVNENNVIALHFTDNTIIQITGSSFSGVGGLTITDLRTDQLLYDGVEQ